MKKLMVASLMVMAMSANAQAQRIRDLSMTPNEMIQQGVNQNHAGTPLPGPNLTPDFGNTPQGAGTNNGIPPSGAPSNNYMEGYCDPNFKPMISRNARYASMASCLQQQRDEACRMYHAAPNDAQRAMDESINCTAQMNNMSGMDGADDGNGDDEDGWGNGGAAQQRPRMPSSCGAADSRRLSMLKRYWSDQNTAYALVFVPDLVMDNSGTCLNKR